jgi:haloacetate dehalogenase
MLVVWGGRGVVGSRPEDPLTVWRGWAADVRGTAVDAGHFLVEERPAEVLGLLAGFLR